MDVAGIPTVITQNHNEVLACWERCRDVLRMDGHADMGGWIPLRGERSAQEWAGDVGIGAVVLAQVHYGLVRDVYWYNPFAFRRLRRMGTTEVDGRQTFMTGTMNHSIRGPIATWVPSYVEPKGVPVWAGGLRPEPPWSLDVDLDAFACEMPVDNYSFLEPTVRGWRERMSGALRLLRHIPERPSRVYITRSQGDPATHAERYVPASLVDEVQESFLDGLRDLYEDPVLIGACTRTS